MLATPRRTFANLEKPAYLLFNGDSRGCIRRSIREFVRRQVPASELRLLGKKGDVEYYDAGRFNVVVGPRGAATAVDTMMNIVHDNEACGHFPIYAIRVGSCGYYARPKNGEVIAANVPLGRSTASFDLFVQTADGMSESHDVVSDMEAAAYGAVAQMYKNEVKYACVLGVSNLCIDGQKEGRENLGKVAIPPFAMDHTDSSTGISGKLFAPAVEGILERLGNVSMDANVADTVEKTSRILGGVFGAPKLDLGCIMDIGFENGVRKVVEEMGHILGEAGNTKVVMDKVVHSFLVRIAAQRNAPLVDSPIVITTAAFNTSTGRVVGGRGRVVVTQKHNWGLVAFKHTVGIACEAAQAITEKFGGKPTFIDGNSEVV